MTFDKMGLDSDILKALELLEFNSPMPVQKEVIPLMLENPEKDIIALAQTGTGKTAAFGLPLVQNTNAKKKNIQHIILAPTRELCVQITDDLNSYAKFKKKVKITAIYGGASMHTQAHQLKKGTHIVSATPGRLADFIRRGKIDLSEVETVVLDEADEMLNMGFRDELEEILSEIPANRTTYLFSATMPKEVRKISKRYMEEPAEITVGTRNAGAENVQHSVYFVHAKDRYAALKRIVDYNPGIYGIVFCRTRQETRDVAESLMRDGYNSDALHGDLSQQQRDAVMNKFRNKSISILVATDVAARGLDVTELTHIINYNLPDDPEVYTHRSGRTGRAGKSGISVVIASVKEKSKLGAIERQLKKSFEVKSVPTGKEICEKQLFRLVDKMEKTEVDSEQIEPYIDTIMKKLQWLDKEEIIKKFISVEFNRFLQYYSDKEELSSPKNRKEKSKNGSGKKIKEAENMTRFFINIGKVDKLSVLDVIGMILDYTKNKNVAIGDINLQKTYSFFEVDSDFENAVLKGFTNKKYKGRSLNVEIAEKEKPERRSRSERRNEKRKKSFANATVKKRKRRVKN